LASTNTYNDAPLVLSIQSTMVSNINNSKDFAWSGDHDQVAFANTTSQFDNALQTNVYNNTVYVINNDGTGLVTLQLIASEPITEVPEINLTWTPDNTQVVAEVIIGTTDPQVLIYVLPLESSLLTSSDTATVNVDFN
jgi:hypothetical protein